MRATPGGWTQTVAVAVATLVAGLWAAALYAGGINGSGNGGGSGGAGGSLTGAYTAGVGINISEQGTISAVGGIPDPAGLKSNNQFVGANNVFSNTLTVGGLAPTNSGGTIPVSGNLAFTPPATYTLKNLGDPVDSGDAVPFRLFTLGGVLLQGSDATGQSISNVAPAPTEPTAVTVNSQITPAALAANLVLTNTSLEPIAYCFTNGNDATALVGNLAFPFQHASNAVAAVIGNTVPHVKFGPGVFILTPDATVNKVGLSLPNGGILEGIPGNTTLVASNGLIVTRLLFCTNTTLYGIDFDASPSASSSAQAAWIGGCPKVYYCNFEGNYDTLHGVGGDYGGVTGVVSHARCSSQYDGFFFAGTGTVYMSDCVFNSLPPPNASSRAVTTGEGIDLHVDGLDVNYQGKSNRPIFELNSIGGNYNTNGYQRLHCVSVTTTNHGQVIFSNQGTNNIDTIFISDFSWNGPQPATTNFGPGTIVFLTPTVIGSNTYLGTNWTLYTPNNAITNVVSVGTGTGLVSSVSIGVANIKSILLSNGTISDDGSTVTLYPPNPTGATTSLVFKTTITTSSSITDGANVFTNFSPTAFSVTFTVPAGYNTILANASGSVYDADPSGAGHGPDVTLAMFYDGVLFPPIQRVMSDFGDQFPVFSLAGVIPGAAAGSHTIEVRGISTNGFITPSDVYIGGATNAGTTPTLNVILLP